MAGGGSSQYRFVKFLKKLLHLSKIFGIIVYGYGVNVFTQTNCTHGN